MPKRLFRVVVFLLAGWSLFLPPGMCICQFLPAAEVSSPSSPCGCAAQQPGADEDDGCCSDPCCTPEKANQDHGAPSQGAPSKPECPANCPAGGKAQHFKLVEHQHLVGICLADVAAGPLFAVAPECEGTPVLDAPSPPVLPIYLSLCTLLI